jgi:hypothetical protein
MWQFILIHVIPKNVVALYTWDRDFIVVNVTVCCCEFLSVMLFVPVKCSYETSLNIVGGFSP